LLALTVSFFLASDFCFREEMRLISPLLVLALHSFGRSLVAVASTGAVTAFCFFSWSGILVYEVEVEVVVQLMQ
jgi:hypothetical protein